MKELSTEEKAERYDEVVNKLRRFMEQGVNPLITRADVQDFFPQLAESEDDRIRKEIVRFIRMEVEDEIVGNKWLAWLEKHKYTEDDLDKAYKCANEVQYRRGYEDAKKEIVKQDEQKTVWSEEDEKKRTLLISILEVNHPYDYFKVNPANTLNMEAMHTEELVSWLKSLRPQNTWKPSDEQISELGNLVKGLRGRAMRATSKDTLYEAINSLYEDLKKLKG